MRLVNNAVHTALFTKRMIKEIIAGRLFKNYASVPSTQKK